MRQTDPITLAKRTDLLIVNKKKIKRKPIKKKKKDGKCTGRLENKRTIGDYPNCSIIMFSQNIEQNHGDLRGLAVTLTYVKLNQLIIMLKTLKEVK